jgi:hypothetical protein
MFVLNYQSGNSVDHDVANKPYSINIYVDKELHYLHDSN